MSTPSSHVLKASHRDQPSHTLSKQQSSFWTGFNNTPLRGSPVHQKALQSHDIFINTSRSLGSKVAQRTCQ